MSNEFYFWGTVISAVLGFAASLYTVLSGRAEAQARARKIENEITEKVLEQASNSFRQYESKVASMENHISQLEESAEIKNKYIVSIEKENGELRRINKDITLTLNKLKLYVKRLLSDLREQGIEFTEPANGLLDTDELGNQ